VSIHDTFKGIDRLIIFSLAEVEMAEFESGVGECSVRLRIDVQPHRVLEIVFAKIRCIRKQSFDICFERSGRHLVRRLDHLILRERQRLIALIKDLICDLALHRL
jgi:hypothetical protein